MALTAKNQKSYLEITDRNDGFAIAALPAHAAELAPLYAQYGIDFRREEGQDSEVLVFDESADRDKVAEILKAYVEAKGS